MMHRVVLADDVPIFRAGVKALTRGSDIEVVAECGTGKEAIAAAGELQPDLVILSLPLPDMAGNDIIYELRPHRPPPYVLVMSVEADDQTTLMALKAGARSFLSKKADPRDLLNGIRLAANGSGVLSPCVAARLGQILQSAPRAPELAFPTLSRREREVLELIGRGYDNRRISRNLVLAEKTVRNHVSNVLAKLQATSRTQALVKARDAGLCN